MSVIIWLIIIFIELIVLGNISTVWMLGVLALTFSGMLINLNINGFVQSKVGVNACIVYTLIWGLLMFLEPVTREKFGTTDRYAMILSYGGLSLMFIIIGVCNTINQLFICNTRIDGQYLGKIQHGNSIKATYAPKFRYKFKNKTYDGICRITYSHLKIAKYKQGETYSIWISSKYPYYFVLNKKLEGSSLLLLGFGIIAMCSVIYFAAKM